jgi:hypothetical protein
VRTWVAWPTAALAGAALGVGATLTLLAPRGLGLALVGGVVCVTVFVLRPWLTLPTGIVGGPLVAMAVGVRDVQAIVTIHAAILAAGGLAVLLRRTFLPGADRSRRTPADAPMLVLAVVVVACAAYGLTRHAPYDVMVGTYQLAVLPAYYFLATTTFTTSRALRAAGIVYVVAATTFALASLATPGQHGGLLSALAVPPLIVASCRTRGVRRLACLVAVAVLLADVVLAGYRSIWLALGIALLVMVVRGAPSVRRCVALSLAAGVLVVGGGMAMSTGVQERSHIVEQKLTTSSGYRGAEASTGLAVFAANPVLGEGLGQSTPDVYLPPYRVTDVGPVYHAFWVTVLANTGLVGLMAVCWPLAVAIRIGLTDRAGLSLSFAALAAGFVVAASFAGPTDGHWELGLLPALVLLTRAPATRPTPHPPLEVWYAHARSGAPVRASH